MEFSFLHVDVDGTLRNPYVVAVVVLWAATLATLSALAARSWRASRMAKDPRGRGRGVANVVSVLLLYVTTPLIQHILGNVLYIVTSEGVTSVGFWGGPPNYPAWVAGLIGALLGWKRTRTRDAVGETVGSSASGGAA